MKDVEGLKEMATIFRETADAIDLIVQNTDESKEDELMGNLMVKILKLERMQESI